MESINKIEEELLNYLKERKLELFDNDQIKISFPIQKALQWLVENQNQDGGWGKIEAPKEGQSFTWKTSLAVWTLNEYGIIDEIYSKGIDWLISNQNKDSGWGAYKGEESRTWLTSLALIAFSTCSFSEIESFLKKGINWLLKNQNQDGGWGKSLHENSDFQSTSLAVIALKSLRSTRKLDHAIKRGANWLNEKMNSDGSWGLPEGRIDLSAMCLWAAGRDSRNKDIAIQYILDNIGKHPLELEGGFVIDSPVDYCAFSLLALCNLNEQYEIPGHLLIYLLSNQNDDGSWNEKGKGRIGKTGTTSLVLLGFSKISSKNLSIIAANPEDVMKRFNQFVNILLEIMKQDFLDKGKKLTLYLYLVYFGLGIVSISSLYLYSKINSFSRSDFLALVGVFISIYFAVFGGMIRNAK